MRRDLEHEGAAMIGIGAPRIVLHTLPSRRDEQAREVRSDESGTAGLPRRYAQAAQLFAVRTVDVDAAPAPARIPDQAFGIDHRAVDTAATRPADQRRRRAA